MSVKHRSQTLPAGKLTHEHLKIVRLQKESGDKNLGLSLNWSNDKGIFVSQIEEGSPAERNGILQTGDQIIWIEKENIVDTSLEQIQEILMNFNKKSLRMVVSQALPDKNEKAPVRKVRADTALGTAQLIPSIWRADEPYSFEVTYLPSVEEEAKKECTDDQVKEYDETESDQSG